MVFEKVVCAPWKVHGQVIFLKLDSPSAANKFLTLMGYESSLPCAEKAQSWSTESSQKILSLLFMTSFNIILPDAGVFRVVRLLHAFRPETCASLSVSPCVSYHVSCQSYRPWFHNHNASIWRRVDMQFLNLFIMQWCSFLPIAFYLHLAESSLFVQRCFLKWTAYVGWLWVMKELLNERSWPSLKDAISACTRKTEENREAFVRIDDIVQAILGEVSMIFLRSIIIIIISLSLSLSLLPIIRSVCNNLVDAIACVVLYFPQSLQVKYRTQYLKISNYPLLHYSGILPLTVYNLYSWEGVVR